MTTRRLTRRTFLASAASLPLGWRACATAFPSASAPAWVLLGTDTGEGVYRCRWDAASGRLGQPELASAAFRPTFLTLHPRLPRVYAANEGSGSAAEVSCFAWNRDTGALRLMGKQSAHGDAPCFVSVDATGRSAFVANYAGASLAGFALTVDGLLLPATGTLHCKGASACGTPGPMHDRQDSSHLHCATIAPGNEYLLSCDLGTDSIEVVAIHPTADSPLGNAFRVAARPGSGPRHVAFHPNGRWAYVMHELDCTLERFDWNTTAGHSHLARQAGTAVSTLQPGEPLAGNTGCEVLIAPDGRFLYSCTRGVDIVTVHRIAPDGALHPQQRLRCGGTTPRHMAFDPTQRFLLCANQAAPGSVTVFAHEPATGHLTGPIQTLAAPTPMFVLFA